MSSAKSTGLDDISVKILKHSSTVSVPSLTKLFNLSISTKIVPDEWKQAKVLPLFKSGNVENCSNYRPISILPIITKILEKHIHTHLYKYLQDYNLISTNQSGFRPNHSCETALHHMMDRWLHAIEKGQYTGSVFIDLSKAFDCIDHGLLLSKLF